MALALIQPAAPCPDNLIEIVRDTIRSEEAPLHILVLADFEEGLQRQRDDREREQWCRQWIDLYRSA